ncbi:hypothetical protein MAR_026504 [Mya arenaria]|uniref:Uncharacterized protein n=1 Tax=Mya arenaria TaxID=6604 RepID=A0ABY7ETQ6_MYAAR|nr:hypothetical protein MAR_026504 [Mya arenaria]
MDSKKVSEGASTAGRKEDLILRLEAYDRNLDFKGEPILLLEPLDTDWPESGFHQLQLEHRILLPKLSRPQIDGYFKYREATDKNITSDIKRDSCCTTVKELEPVA